MNRLNMLKEYMDFAKQNGIMGPDYSSHNGFNPTPYNPSALASQWAERQLSADDAGQDFFGGGGGGGAPGGGGNAAFVRPERFQGPPPAPYAHSDPMRGQVQNYLRRMLGAR